MPIVPHVPENPPNNKSTANIGGDDFPFRNRGYIPVGPAVK